MKILVVHPGASMSTADVHAGLTTAWERMGVELIHFNLDGRLDRAASWLRFAWRKGKKQGLDLAKPNDADIQYQASVGVIERALRHQPDWVFIISAMYMHPDAVVMLKRAGQRVALLFTESPYDDPWQMKLLPYVDAYWVNERSSLPKFRLVNPYGHYYQHAIDLEKHKPGGLLDTAHDVVFVGSGFQERVDLLKAVNWDGIDLGLYGSWVLLPSRSRVRKYIKGSIVGNDRTAALYRSAKIGLNLHRTSIGFGRAAPRIEHAESLNPRCYELAATGCFFISDYRAELGDVFDGLVPTFKTPEECEEKIRYYLERKDERERIAKRLPAKVLGHTFDKRAREILGVLENGLHRNS